MGLVASLNRPGGNATGMTLSTSILTAKRLELVRELVPAGAVIAVLLNPTNASIEFNTKDVQAAARTLGQQIDMLYAAGSEDGFETAFATVVQRREAALVVGADPLFNDRRVQLIVLAARHAIPTIYESREYARAGGLLSYGPSFPDVYRTHQGLHCRRNHRPALLALLHGTRSRDRPAGTRAADRRAGRALRGRGVARAQRRHSVLGKRRHRSHHRREWQPDRVCQDHARYYRAA